MEIKLYKGDIPTGIDWGTSVAIDTEAMGLKNHRDRLCVVQISKGDGVCHIVHFPTPHYEAPHLKALLKDPHILKIFHFARFDVAILYHYLGVLCAPVFCTKVASKLVRTFTMRHSLKELCKEFVGIDLSKQEQTSDWGAPDLTETQLNYAASDVLYLHQIKNSLEGLLKREGRLELAQDCFACIPTIARLDLLGWAADDNLFNH